ncbi:hypothetical protein NRK67_03880 [Fusobacteria bacterium ZRK30]|nr:hypothetical protein NRK67_03880 [Fusobacteria bacterium ZRK30]
MNLKSKIFLIFGLLFFIGCTSVENKILDIPTYSKEKKVYSVLDNKPINGVMENKGFYSEKEYSTYKKGVLSNLKKVNKTGELTFDQSFDEMGLRHGVSFDKKGKTSEYSHGVLNGEISSEDYRGNKIVERYSDGVLNGVQEKSYDKKLFFSQGLRIAEDTQPAVKKQSRVVIWGEIPRENFTGELYGEAKKDIINNYSAVMQVENYKNGVLLSRKYYDKEGKKLYEFHFMDGNVKKIVKKVMYSYGILKELKNYDSDGNLNGKCILRSYYSNHIEIKNYRNGIPHGEVEILIKNDDKLDKKIGFYDKGIYSGYRNGRYYKEGIEVDKELTKTLSSNFTITNIKDIKNKESFSGYTKQVINNNNIEDVNVYYYENGFLKEEYQYRNNVLIQSKYYLKSKKYIQTTYQDGIIQRISNYNADGVPEGQFLAYEHENSKTIGYIVNGVIEGKSIHYHGDKVYYVDSYNKGKEYKRTIYYDYEKKHIKQTHKGAHTNTSWIKVGLDKTYYENGKLKKDINYGDGLSFEKKVEVTEYYSNGKIKSKGIMNYYLNINIGKKIEFYEDGKKKAEQNYGDQGYSVGPQKYYYSNGKLKKIENYNERGYRHGTLKIYNEDGKLIEEAEYKNGYKK